MRISKRNGHTCLRIKIHKQYLFPSSCQSYTNIDAGEGLANTAFLIDDSYYFCVHFVSSKTKKEPSFVVPINIGYVT